MKLLIKTLMIIALCTSPAWANDIYVTQSGGGSFTFDVLQDGQSNTKQPLYLQALYGKGDSFKFSQICRVLLSSQTIAL